MISIWRTFSSRKKGLFRFGDLPPQPTRRISIYQLYQDNGQFPCGCVTRNGHSCWVRTPRPSPASRSSCRSGTAQPVPQLAAPELPWRSAPWNQTDRRVPLRVPRPPEVSCLDGRFGWRFYRKRKGNPNMQYSVHGFGNQVETDRWPFERSCLSWPPHLNDDIVPQHSIGCHHVNMYIYMMSLPRAATIDDREYGLLHMHCHFTSPKSKLSGPSMIIFRPRAVGLWAKGFRHARLMNVH